MCRFALSINPENVGFDIKSRQENVINTAESHPKKCEF